MLRAYAAHYSHAWLELGGVQIDITADQFLNDPEKLLWTGQSPELRDDVIVKHRQKLARSLDEERQHSADIRSHDARTRAILEPRLPRNLGQHINPTLPAGGGRVTRPIFSRFEKWGFDLPVEVLRTSLLSPLTVDR